jgi:hypothetical protein
MCGFPPTPYYDVCDNQPKVSEKNQRPNSLREPSPIASSNVSLVPNELLPVRTSDDFHYHLLDRGGGDGKSQESPTERRWCVVECCSITDAGVIDWAYCQGSFRKLGGCE